MSTEGPIESLADAEDLYEQIQARTKERHLLFNVHWELTYRCNQHCSHCYLNIAPPRANEPGALTTDECFRVIDQLSELGAMELTLSGGEVLAHRGFFEIAEYARARRFLLRIFTNGIAVSAKTAQRIAALHPYSVEISVYSTDAAVHDAITRRHGSFERTIHALGLLHEHGVRTVMKTILMHERARELEALQALADRLGAQFRYAVTVTAKDDGNPAPLGHRMTYEELIALFRKTMNPDDWLKRKDLPEDRLCNVGLNSLVIDPCGNIFPCVGARILAGNVRAQPLKAIWEESSVWADMQNLTWERLTVCYTCELRKFCFRCHGIARMDDGDLLGPARVNCREALARRQVLIEKKALPEEFPIPAHMQAWTP